MARPGWRSRTSSSALAGFTAIGTQLGAVYELRYRLEAEPACDRSWWGGGSLELDLGDADFFDLGWSPLFNSLPVIRDELLRIGPPREYLMRWIDVPSLEVRRSEQRYEPLGDGRVRFTAGEFAFRHPVRRERVRGRLSGHRYAGVRPSRKRRPVSSRCRGTEPGKQIAPKDATSPVEWSALVLRAVGRLRLASLRGGSGWAYVCGPGSGVWLSPALSVAPVGAWGRDGALRGVVDLRGLGLAVVARLVPAAEDLVPAGVGLRARAAGVRLAALASEGGAGVGSRCSISSASARSSFAADFGKPLGFVPRALAHFAKRLRGLLAQADLPQAVRSGSVFFLAMVLLVGG